MPRVAIAFDFDGVILDSESMKFRAFTSIFGDYPDAIERISAYNAHYRGVPRIDKIRYICEHILGFDDCDVAVDMFLKNYAAALKEGLAHTTLIPGITQFLEQTPFPKFVCSSAPQAEVTNIIADHNISHHFTKVFGYPQSKAGVLKRLKQSYHSLIFFGDAIADYEAARAAQVTFIGVVNAATHDQFKGLGVPHVAQFRDVASIHSLIAQLAGLGNVQLKTGNALPDANAHPDDEERQNMPHGAV